MALLRTTVVPSRSTVAQKTQL